MKSFFDDENAAEEEITMPHQHRTIVNTYFEELPNSNSGSKPLTGSDRNAISLQCHIRQLIFISIYPPEEVSDAVTNSPRKLQQHRQRRERLPSPEASRLAVNMLCAFSRTNGPQSLFQAIPHHRGFGGKSLAFKDESAGDEAVYEEMKDSPIGDDARRTVGEAADCWDLIRPGVVRRSGRASSEDGNEEDSNSTMSSAVGTYSWGFLEVLVVSFEEDERRNLRDADLLFSPLLLKHIPRMRPPLPWNFERPLNVVFSCLTSSRDAPGQPYHPHHAQLGIRLLSLLVNATLGDSRLAPSAKTLVDLCTNHMRQVYISSQQLQYLFATLMLAPHFRPFVLALACSLLEGSVLVHGQATAEDSSTPRPKAKPRPRVAGANAPSDGTAPAAPEQSTSLVKPYPLPSLENVLRHLASSSVTPHFALSLSAKAGDQLSTTNRLELDAQKSAVAKTHLLQCLNIIIVSDTTSKTQITQDQWVEALQSGKFRKAVKTGFTHTTGLAEDSLFKSVFKPLCETIVEDLELDGAMLGSENVPLGS